MKPITSQNLANAMTELVAADALPAMLGNLVMGNLVTREHLFEAGDGAHAEATFQVPDITKILAVPELLRLYMEPAVAALVEKIEGDIGGLRLAESGLPDDWPRSEQKFLVASPVTYAVLRRRVDFSEYQSAGEAGLRAMIDGPVGRLGGFFAFRSPFVNGCKTFTRRAIKLTTRRLPAVPMSEYAEISDFGMRVMMNYQPNTLAQQFTLECLYSVEVLDAGWGAEVNVVVAKG